MLGQSQLIGSRFGLSQGMWHCNVTTLLTTGDQPWTNGTLRQISQDTGSQRQFANESNHRDAQSKDGQTCTGQEKQVPYLPTHGRISGEVLCSQDVSVYHVLHKGEVHQVLPVSVGVWGMVPLLKTCRGQDSWGPQRQWEM